MKPLQIAPQFEILSDYITQPNCLFLRNSPSAETSFIHKNMPSSALSSHLFPCQTLPAIQA
jgi:hypothetical protein